MSQVGGDESGQFCRHKTFEMNNSKTITNFIEQIWNQQNFDRLEDFLHPDFMDHSLPPGAQNGAEGLKSWIIATSQSFQHKTIVEDVVADVEKCVVRIRFDLIHFGTWRGMEATGERVNTNGFRMFRLKDGKIIEHWGLLNAQLIENGLKKTAKGCVVKG